MSLVGANIALPAAVLIGDRDKRRASLGQNATRCHMHALAAIQLPANCHRRATHCCEITGLLWHSLKGPMAPSAGPSVVSKSSWARTLAFPAQPETRRAADSSRRRSVRERRKTPRPDHRYRLQMPAAPRAAHRWRGCPPPAEHRARQRHRLKSTYRSP